LFENKILGKNMLNQKSIIELTKDEDIDNYYLLLKKYEIRLNKNNKEYVYCEFADKKSSIIGNFWNNFDKDEILALNPGDVVFLRGKIIEFNNSLQINITKMIKAISVSSDEFIEKSQRPLDEMLAELKAFYNSMNNIFLKKLLDKILFNNESNFNKYIKTPAGKSWHHAYISGLLEHTLEIIKICDLSCTFHKEINRDLLITGAILHDFGKIYEISSDPGFEYTDEGKLIGHIVISAMEIEKIINGIDDFPKELRDQIIHLILSHQGKLEHASPVIPKTLEAITLYHADELSAKMNAYKNAILNNTVTNKWTKRIPLAETELFVPDNDYNFDIDENNDSLLDNNTIKSSTIQPELGFEN